VRVGRGSLTLKATGTVGDVANAAAALAAISFTPLNHNNTVEVEVTLADTAGGGLLLSRASRSVNAGVRKDGALAFWQGVPISAPWKENHIFVRVHNNSSDISVAYSADGRQWTPFDNSTSAPGIRSISLYAAGEGELILKTFKYRGLDLMVGSRPERQRSPGSPVPQCSAQFNL
jgi:hypothetical protein